MEAAIPGVHVVSGASKAFIVDGDSGVTLIDTGMPKRPDAIIETLAKIGRSPSDVNAILVTHSHSDHVGGAAALKQATGAALFAPVGDAPTIEGRAATVPPPLFDRFRFLEPFFRFVPGADPVEVDHLVSEADSAELPEDLRVIDTPGHTPGHVSYLLNRSGGVLFAGDAAVASRRGEVKRGFMNASTPTFDASLRHLAELDFEVALFAHSRPIAHGAAAAFRSFVASFG